MSRWRASSIHLALSVAILGLVSTVLVWRWYPPSLFHTVNAGRLLATIAGTHLTLGPLLTLVVYKQGKKYLKFDLAIIALLQLAALVYGLHAVWLSRPVYLVAVVDRFELVFANELAPADLQNAPERYRTLPWAGTETISAPLPADRKRKEDLLFQTLETGRDIQLLPSYYMPYGPAARRELLSHSLSAREFASRLSAGQAAEFADSIGDMSEARLRVVPINSGRGSATMVLDAGTGEPLKPVAVDPWPVFNALSAPNSYTGNMPRNDSS
jgi:hypothetical protein